MTAMTATTDLGPVAWPPVPLRTERLVLRAAEARDRAAFVDLFASPEVGTYIGGAQPRDHLARVMPEKPGQRPGFFVIDLDGEMIGTVTLDRRDVEAGEGQDDQGHEEQRESGEHPDRSDHPGHTPPTAGPVELGFLLLPQAWGHGYAAEASEAALAWLAAALPGEPVTLRTQTANARAMRLASKLGFTEVERFEAYGAEQWSGVRPAHA
ncbi:GNAT family N-acetyltransferase [Streptomyces sp. NPDC046203]|uniref:GNAT family N-acetyltransferase n=1 Tax=Streptomyces sp. NPDC046203 TaxID=3154602 RepID=UPI0033F8600C